MDEENHGTGNDNTPIRSPEINNSKNFMIDNLLSKDSNQSSFQKNSLEDYSWKWNVSRNEEDSADFCADSSTSLSEYVDDGQSSEQEVQEVSTSSEECCSKFDGKSNFWLYKIFY